jgi:hypothetical protein
LISHLTVPPIGRAIGDTEDVADPLPAADRRLPLAEAYVGVEFVKEGEIGD